MTRLDDRTRQALLALDDPPPGMQQRIHQAILASGPPGGGDPGGGDAGGGGDPGGGGGASAAAGKGALELGFAAKVVGATLGMTAAGLVVLGLAGAGVRALRANESPVDATAKVEQVELDSLGPTPAAELTPSPAIDTATATQNEPLGEQLDAPRPRPAPGVAPTPTTTTTLEAELALMQQARAAKTAKARLALLLEHRAEFPLGVLADEREVLRVETLCALDRHDEAEQVAAAFIAAKPSNPLRSRVEPACSK